MAAERMLGIVGGVGPESTADYYRRLIDRWRVRGPAETYPPPSSTPETYWLRPPGSLPESQFRDTCSRCASCRICTTPFRRRSPGPNESSRSSTSRTSTGDSGRVSPAPARHFVLPARASSPEAAHRCLPGRDGPRPSDGSRPESHVDQTVTVESQDFADGLMSRDIADT